MYSLHVCVSVCLWVCVCWERVLSAVDIKVSLLKREPLQSSVRRLALGCMESSNVAWALKHPLFTYSWTHTHTHTRTHTRHLTNGARYKMLGNLFMCMCVSTWLYSTWLYEYITVRWARVERRGFLLRDLLNFAVQLAGGGLVEFDAVGQTACLDGVQQTKCSNSIHVSSVFSQIEGDLGKKERREEYIQKHW